MTVAGPRVLQVIGEDYGALRTLARQNEDGIPYVAVLVQSIGALLLIALADFRSILVFTGFTLALNSLVTVSALARLRRKTPTVHRPFSVPLYPLPLLIYACLTIWTLIYVLLESPIEALVSAGLIGSGIAVYALSRRASRRGRAL